MAREIDAPVYVRSIRIGADLWDEFTQVVQAVPKRTLREGIEAALLAWCQAELQASGEGESSAQRPMER